MTIYDQIIECLKGKEGKIITSSEIKLELVKKYKLNPKSIILSDFCYNRYNSGIKFDKHLFHYNKKNSYTYLGEKYPYNKFVYHKSIYNSIETIVGKWENGIYFKFQSPSIDDAAIDELYTNKIVKLYERYSEVLKDELHDLNCKPTELRHLIGRLGEFWCAIEKKGVLAKNTNQHGFDVIVNQRKISVKTTAQKNGFITINKGTYNYFDDLCVIQYVDNNFKIIFYDKKERIFEAKPTEYLNSFEININRLMNINNK